MLAGGFKCFLCSPQPLFGEESHFDHFDYFSIGLFQPPTSCNIDLLILMILIWYVFFREGIQGVVSSNIYIYII